MSGETPVSVHQPNDLQYCPGHAGKGARAFFDSSKDAFITKQMALANRYILEDKETPIADPEIALGYAFGPSVKSAAMANGWSLVECLQFTLEQIKTRRPVSRPMDSPDHLASLLSRVAPNMDGHEALAQLKALIEGVGEDAALLLNNLLAKHGRDDDGFIRLRAKATKKQVS